MCSLVAMIASIVIFEVSTYIIIEFQKKNRKLIDFLFDFVIVNRASMYVMVPIRKNSRSVFGRLAITPVDRFNQIGPLKAFRVKFKSKNNTTKRIHGKQTNKHNNAHSVYFPRSSRMFSA